MPISCSRVLEKCLTPPTSSERPDFVRTMGRAAYNRRVPL
jgi:hypothetical protein